MHKLVSGLAALLVSVSLVLTLGASPATAVAGDAGHSKYVTKQEFRNVKKGMTIKKVHAIFDIKGKQVLFFPAYPALGMSAEQQREYKVKSKWGMVSVDFKKKNGTWVLARKWAFWG